MIEIGEPGEELLLSMRLTSQDSSDRLSRIHVADGTTSAWPTDSGPAIGNIPPVRRHQYSQQHWWLSWRTTMFRAALALALAISLVSCSEPDPKPEPLNEGPVVVISEDPG